MRQLDLSVTRSQKILTGLVIAACLAMAAASWFRFDAIWTPGAKHLSTSPLGYLARVVSGLGNVAVPLAFFLMLWLLWDEKRLAVNGFLAMAFSGVGSTLGKAVFVRSRPDWSEYSFPSGHSTLMFAVAFVLGQRYPKLRWLFYLIAAAVATTRVLLRKHYPSDVFAGAAVGLLAAMLAVALARKIPDPPDRRWLRVAAAVLLVALCVDMYVGSRKMRRMARVVGPAVGFVVAVRCGQLFYRSRRRGSEASSAG
jgi:undecaprenyl-diphosphatase